jgi:histidinol dehydrogenase
MKKLFLPERSYWKNIAARPQPRAAGIEKKVRRILAKVKANGDKAVRRFTREFDGIKIKDLSVSPEEIRNASALLSTELKNAIELAKNNIETFHRSQLNPTLEKVTTMPGINCWRKSVAIEKVGIYIPGGSAPLFSTVLMLAIPARLAGCKEIVLCSPPGKNGGIHPAILYAASVCGITKIFKAGGAQAIAAMAYGTETIPSVFKITGPGNRFVTVAKQLVQQGSTAIDMPAGPSELLVIGDETSNARFIAADLLSQAEHGPDSQVILITKDQVLADKVILYLEEMIKELPRKKIAKKALANSKILLASSIEEAIEFSNYYAPEHLIIACRDALPVSEQVTSAGSVFIGDYSPEAAGDYATGTNHTLPTGGYAAMYSGVSVDSFVKKITYQQLTVEGLRAIAPSVMCMAEAEGLKAHSDAIAIRIK